MIPEEDRVIFTGHSVADVESVEVLFTVLADGEELWEHPQPALLLVQQLAQREELTGGDVGLLEPPIKAAEGFREREGPSLFQRLKRRFDFAHDRS